MNTPSAAHNCRTRNQILDMVSRHATMGITFPKLMLAQMEDGIPTCEFSEALSELNHRGLIWFHFDTDMVSGSIITSTCTVFPVE